MHSNPKYSTDYVIILGQRRRRWKPGGTVLRQCCTSPLKRRSVTRRTTHRPFLLHRKSPSTRFPIIRDSRAIRYNPLQLHVSSRRFIVSILQWSIRSRRLIACRKMSSSNAKRFMVIGTFLRRLPVFKLVTRSIFIVIDGFTYRPCLSPPFLDQQG